MTKSNRKPLIIVAVVAVIVIAVVAAYFTVDMLVAGNTTAASTGQPQAPTLAIKTKVKTTTPSASSDNAAEFVRFVRPVEQPALLQTAAPFVPCMAVSGSTPTPQGSQPTAVATVTATDAAPVAAATMAATAEADYLVLQIVGDESEACYQVGEIFISENNQFNLAVGISKAISGQIAIDRNNLANSQVGEIVVDVSQLTSDSNQRDGQIRRRWLESNAHPLAKFTPVEIDGLPARPLQDGETLSFKMIGNLLVREKEVPTAFNVTATLKDNVLTGTATTDVKMTDFGFDPPDIGGMIKANNDAHIILNFVAREAK